MKENDSTISICKNEKMKKWIKYRQRYSCALHLVTLYMMIPHWARVEFISSLFRQIDNVFLDCDPSVYFYQRLAGNDIDINHDRENKDSFDSQLIMSVYKSNVKNNLHEL